MAGVKRINNGKVTIEVGRPNVISKGVYRGHVVTVIQIVQNLDIFSVYVRMQDGTEMWISPYDIG